MADNCTKKYTENDSRSGNTSAAVRKQLSTCNYEVPIIYFSR